MSGRDDTLTVKFLSLTSSPMAVVGELPIKLKHWTAAMHWTHVRGTSRTHCPLIARDGSGARNLLGRARARAHT